MQLAHRLARFGLGLLCLTLGAVLLLVADVVLEGPYAPALALGFTAATASLWFLPPARLRAGKDERR